MKSESGTELRDHCRYWWTMMAGCGACCQRTLALDDLIWHFLFHVTASFGFNVQAYGSSTKILAFDLVWWSVVVLKGKMGSEWHESGTGKVIWSILEKMMVSSDLYASQGEDLSEKVVYRYPRNQGHRHDEPEQQVAICWIFFAIISKGLEHFSLSSKAIPTTYWSKTNSWSSGPSIGVK